MFLARLLTEQNEIGAAVEAYKRSIEMEPENVDLIHNLGMLYLKVQKIFFWTVPKLINLQIEDQSNAFGTFGKALSYEPNYVPSMLAIASILQSNGDWDVALSKYKSNQSIKMSQLLIVNWPLEWPPPNTTIPAPCGTTLACASSARANCSLHW